MNERKVPMYDDVRSEKKKKVNNATSRDCNTSTTSCGYQRSKHKAIGNEHRQSPAGLLQAPQSKLPLC